MLSMYLLSSPAVAVGGIVQESKMEFHVPPRQVDSGVFQFGGRVMGQCGLDFNLRVGQVGHGGSRPPLCVRPELWPALSKNVGSPAGLKTTPDPDF